MPKSLAIRLSAAGQRHARAGHPWLYQERIESIKGSGEAGDLAVLFDRKKNSFLGVGLYDPSSPIRIKMLHAGKPLKIDQSFFVARIEKAYALRQPLMEDGTNAFRLLNGENDGFPGLIVDVYNTVMVVKVYSLIWGPWLPPIIDYCQQLVGANVAVLRLSRNIQNHPDKPSYWEEGKLVSGALPDAEVTFIEHGVCLSTNVLEGHKTGFFLDHRANRKRIQMLSYGKDVLDIFSYAGGFSVHALVGGAKEVTSLDISKQALAIARKNVSLNTHSGKHSTLAGDAFIRLDELGKQGKKYDLIIVDPPSFAKRSIEVPGALAAYKRLTKLVLPLISKGGILLLASCSSRVTSDEFYALQDQVLNDQPRPWIELARTGHDIDHPISFPEGSYLKSLYVQVN